MTAQEKMRFCSGCRNNFYNGRDNISGKNCWSLEDAQVVKRLFIHRDQIPPYKGEKLRDTLSCWYGDTGMRAVDPEAITKEGFWK